MNKNEISIIYKEPGKEPISKQIRYSFQTFQELLGNDITSLPFKDILIIYKKNNDKLKPNIYISEHMKFGTVIRGNIIVVGLENKRLKSLTISQTNKYIKFLIQEQFNYTHFDENGRYLSNKELAIRNKFKNNNMQKSNKYKITKQTNSSTIENTLNTILKIQFIILQFIQEFNSQNDL